MTMRKFSAWTIATALGFGLSPVAPGTMGTLVGVAVVYFSNPLQLSWKVLIWSVLLVSGTWSASVIDQLTHKKDNQKIVIDEVVGYGITAWTAQNHWSTLIAAFLLFRFFDIFKLPPVRQIDQWSKNRTVSKSFWSGFGVMADDLVAGFQALLVILFLQLLQLLP